MHLKTLLPILLTTPVLASSPLLPRDLPTITSAMTAVEGEITKLVQQFSAFNGDIAATEPILQASASILAAIKQGTQAITATEPIGILDAASILPAVSSLSAKVDEIAQVLGQKKALLDQKQLSPVVLEQLKDQRQATEGMVQAVTSKLPSAVQGLASPIAGQITAKLDSLIASFGGTTTGVGGASAPKVSGAPRASASAMSMPMRWKPREYRY